MTLLDNPKYFNRLYHLALQEIRGSDPSKRTYFPKWKRDILLSLLERVKPEVKRKHLRKKVSADLKKISDEARKEIDEKEEEEMKKWIEKVQRY
jgi:hypothetical protein